MMANINCNVKMKQIFSSKFLQKPAREYHYCYELNWSIFYEQDID